MKWKWITLIWNEMKLFWMIWNEMKWNYSEDEYCTVMGIMRFQGKLYERRNKREHRVEFSGGEKERERE